MRTILFDVDGVLIHGYHARLDLRKCWDENLERDFGIDRERFKNEFIFETFIKNVLVGKKGLKDELAIALPQLGFHGDPQTFIDYWLKNDACINYPLLDKIKTLKSSGKVRLFIATNQEHNRARFLMNDLGFEKFFDDIFYSAHIGSLKPDRSYFEWISKFLNLASADKPIFFDDTPSVVSKACEYGWEAIEFIEPEDLNKSEFVRGLISLQ